jgi:MraZ protein
MALTSNYECKVDTKGRILLPGKLKTELADVMPSGFIIKRSVFSPCLELWPMKEWEEKLALINKLNRFIEKNARFIRKFLAGVRHVGPDATGRLNIPNELMAFAGIEKEVVIASQINILEIWDKARFEAAVGDGEDFGRLTEDVMGVLGNERII